MQLDSTFVADPEAPVSWLQPQWRRLVRAKERMQLAHAFLFFGPKGLGKRHLAASFAHALLCQQPDQRGLSCGHCRDCAFVQAGTHPDMFRVAGRKAGTIRVDDVREMNAFLQQTGNRGSMRVGLIEPAEHMNLNAANSLLKTLEEPPPGALLILISDAVFQVPATVRSRCLPLRCCYPQNAHARSWLQSRVEEQYDIDLLLALAHGAPLLALRYADANAMTRRSELWSGLLAIASGRTLPAHLIEEKFIEVSREDLRWFAGWQTDMIKLKMSEHTPVIGNPDLRRELLQLANRFSLQALFFRYDQILSLYQQTAVTQVNRQLQLETYLNLFLPEALSAG